jgi:hypothetical protein
MSSTNRGGERDSLDRYYTPQALADAIVGALDEGEGPRDGWTLEPSVGAGAFVHAVRSRWKHSHVRGIDIDPDAPGLAMCSGFWLRDFAEWHPVKPPSLIVGNPPFHCAEAHVRHAVDIVKHDGHVVFLLRLAMLEGQARRALWAEHPPKRVLVLPRRPSFTDGGTDSAAYGVFIWQRGFSGVPTLGWLDWRP